MEGSGDSVEGARASIFQGDLPLGEKLERARTELLDLSARNRLLSVPRSSKAAKTVEVVGARAADVFQILVRDERPMTFVPGKADEDEEEDGPKKEAKEGKELGDAEGAEVAVQTADSVEDARDAADPRSAKRLQTRMTPKGLQKRLMDLHLDARTLEEEQGTNILFLVLGTLKWTDPGKRFEHTLRSAHSNSRQARESSGGPEVQAPPSSRRTWRPICRSRPTSTASHALRMPEADFGDDFDPTAYLAGWWRRRSRPKRHQVGR